MGNRTLRIALRVLLALSLLLNAIFLGLALRLNALGAELGLTGQDLTRAERVEFRAAAETDPDIQAALADLRSAREAMFAQLDVTPPDPAAIEAAMAEVREATTRLQTASQAILLAILTDTE